MPEVSVKKGESIDRALKRLKNKLESEGVLEEIRRLRAFETPVQRFRRKQRAAAKKSRHKFRFNLNQLRKDTSKDSEAGSEAPPPDPPRTTSPSRTSLGILQEGARLSGALFCLHRIDRNPGWSGVGIFAWQNHLTSSSKVHEESIHHHLAPSRRGGGWDLCLPEALPSAGLHRAQRGAGECEAD